MAAHSLARFRRTAIALCTLCVTFFTTLLNLWYKTSQSSTVSEFLQARQLSQDYLHAAGPGSITQYPTPLEPLRVDESLSAWFPYTGKPKQDGWPYWEDENQKSLAKLMDCMMHHSCNKNQDKVVILESYHFRGALVGWVGGEDVWAKSTIEALKNLGYTYLFAESIYHATHLHQMFPSLVVAIFMEAGTLDECWKDEFHCVKSPHNPYGIPIWKMLSFHFWTDARVPLGANWTLSPEPYAMEGYSPNVHLGYSVEPSCKTRTPVEHHDRLRRAYIMTKRLQYLSEANDAAWPREFYESAAAELGIDLVLGVSDTKIVDKNGRELDPQSAIPTAVHNLGFLKLPDFLDELSKSQVVIGVGLPYTSPTPYEALCLGVPFINPVKSWDHDHPENRQQWDAQHGILKFSNPPYVYNVLRGDKRGFIDAIRLALSNPIESFTLDHMRMFAVEARLQNILNRDHFSMASDILSRRQTGQEDGPRFTL